MRNYLRTTIIILIFTVEIKDQKMETVFYILEMDQFGNITEKRIQPEKQEIRQAENSIGWGATKGVISFITPIRRSTVYWKLIKNQEI